MVHAVLEINRRCGDEIRRDLHAKVRHFVEGLADLGIEHYSVNNHPAVHVVCGKVNQVYQWNAILKYHGVFVGFVYFH